MKSRTSFFNTSIFRKNITRFFPLWALYTIFLLLILAGQAQAGEPGYTARELVQMMGPMTLVNLLYGFLSACLLMGDLFQSRMCNALHALPLRRETWLITHVASGLVFSLIPNILVSIVAAALTLQYAYLSLLWLAAVTLQFLFFFGTAIFAAVCAGNRLGMAAVYGIFHFITMLIYGMAELLYLPLLYGVRMDPDVFYRFFPFLQLLGNNYVDIDYLPTSMDLIYRGIVGETWVYAGLCAAVGVLFVGVALLVYRRRQLESAGDFLSLRSLGPVFLVIYTLGAGSVGFLFSELFMDAPSYLFLAVGLVVGFFTGQMLLSRSVNVFRKKNFIRFAILLVALGISLGLTKLDLLGITRIIPKTEDVQWAAVCSSDYDYYYSDVYKYNRFQITEPEELEQLRQFHSLLTDGQAEKTGPRLKVTILYARKDGTRLTRYYEIPAESALGQQAKPYFSDMRYIFQTNYPQLLYKHVESVSIECYEGELLEKWGVETNPYGYTNIALKDVDEITGLLDAIAADCREGTMAQDWVYRTQDPQLFSLDFSFSEEWKTDRGGKYYLTVFESSKNTVAYLRDHLSTAQ